MESANSPEMHFAEILLDFKILQCIFRCNIKLLYSKEKINREAGYVKFSWYFK